MRFCDKLAKLRKENNLSQEQFADKMCVSRQAVSKWESGSSYPDMDKILTMCKILNCNLEDLLDDGVIGSTKKGKGNDYFDDFLNFITKTYNMFWSMKFKEKIKCLFELFIIFILLFIFGSILYSILYNFIVNNISVIPKIGIHIANVIDSLILLSIVILGFIIFLHLFKIRYLDYFITIEDCDAIEKTKEEALPEEKIINNKKYIVENKREKIIIRDPEHSKYHFLNILGKLILWIIKFFVIMFTIPFIVIVIFMIMSTFMSFSFVKYGVLFLFIALAIIGALIISYIILYFIYNFIFNRKINFKIMFYVAIVGLIMMGGFTGLSIIEFMDYEHSEITDSDYIEKKENIKMEEGLFISSYELTYEIDNNVSDVTVLIKLPKGFNYSMYKVNDEFDSGLINLHIVSDDFNIFSAYKIIKQDLKDNKIKIYEYDNLSVKIISNEENINKLKQNYDKYYDEYIY